MLAAHPTGRIRTGGQRPRLGRSLRPRTTALCCRRCAPGEIRTPDAGLRTASLYPLSYGGGGTDSTAEHRPTRARRTGNTASRPRIGTLDDLLPSPAHARFLSP